MDLKLVPLYGLRILGKEENILSLDGRALNIVSTDNFTEQTDSSDLTSAIGIATILYNWCPQSLFTLLDRDSWFSMTWTLTLPNETKLEIGRIRDQITFGTLDTEGMWKLMVSYDISGARCTWLPNKETMLDGRDVSEPAVIDQLGRDWVRDAFLQKRWETGKKMKHEFFVEYAPMDVWGDGIRMNPHWLYEGLDLMKCTTCSSNHGDGGKTLSRCGKCGTAAYGSAECQRKDWAVHKGVCSMSMEDRGTALHLTKNGGLVNWKTVEAAEDDVGEDEVEIVEP